MSKLRCALLVACLFSTPILLASTAHADCVSVEVRLWTSGNTHPSYLVGPKKCVVSTPWGVTVQPSIDDKEGLVPTGYPNGAGVTVWIPAP